MKSFEILYREYYEGDSFEHFCAGLKTEIVAADNEWQACFEFGVEWCSTMSIEILRINEIEIKDLLLKQLNSDK